MRGLTSKIEYDDDGTHVLIEKQPDEPDDGDSAMGSDLDAIY